MDKILLESLRLDIRVGVTEDERSVPQLCGLDVTLYVNLRPSGKSGDLKKSVDYSAVFRRVEEICTHGQFILLEEIGEQVCADLFLHFPLEKIRVKVRKLHPFSPKLSAVGIEMTRTQKLPKRDRR